MGQYDWSVNTGCDCILYDAWKDVLRIYCYWKCNGWRYNFHPVYGYVTCNGEERVVYNGGQINFQNNQSNNLLGYSDFTIWRGYETKTSSYSARIYTDTYAPGNKASGTGYYYTGAKAAYTISYNANGGSNAPAAQKKWLDENITLSTAWPSRTGYTFQGWATSANGAVAYYAGSTYSANEAVTLYAVWKVNTFNVIYNANGGSNAPANQVKTYGQNLTLSSQKPFKTDYNFLGWDTKQDGTGTRYPAGGTYTANVGVTLYAQWEVAYIKPRITAFNAVRTDSAGNADEYGTYLKFYYVWATDLAVTKITCEWKKLSDTSWQTKQMDASGTSGSKTAYVGDGSISPDSSYLVRVSVSDSKGISYSAELTIGTPSYPIDVKAQGKGVAFGKAAEKDNAIEIGFKDVWLGGIRIIWYE